SPKIRVQVESVKCKKGNKENCDPHIIPAHEVQVASKNACSLSKNVNKNQLN
ncbi:22442_t:CDS:1, partial [Gigaspora rosea]